MTLTTLFIVLEICMKLNVRVSDWNSLAGFGQCGVDRDSFARGRAG
jgi:hypothetical protein